MAINKVPLTRQPPPKLPQAWKTDYPCPSLVLSEHWTDDTAPRQIQKVLSVGLPSALETLLLEQQQLKQSGELTDSGVQKRMQERVPAVITHCKSRLKELSQSAAEEIRPLATRIDRYKEAQRTSIPPEIRALSIQALMALPPSERNLTIQGLIDSKDKRDHEFLTAINSFSPTITGIKNPVLIEQLNNFADRGIVDLKEQVQELEEAITRAQEAMALTEHAANSLFPGSLSRSLSTSDEQPSSKSNGGSEPNTSPFMTPEEEQAALAE